MLPLYIQAPWILQVQQIFPVGSQNVHEPDGDSGFTITTKFVSQTDSRYFSFPGCTLQTPITHDVHFPASETITCAHSHYPEPPPSSDPKKKSNPTPKHICTAHLIRSTFKLKTPSPRVTHQINHNPPFKPKMPIHIP